ncbi:MAG TPA: SPFH domain-containing protein [Phycisphaerae bacterium]|nr:SPFH domain-containing protein [Phycisphaerae bacterium]
MKSWPTIVAAVALAIVLLLYMCMYQVRSTETAVVKTFGNVDPDSVKRDAGLYVKWPWPIQMVEKYDQRLRVLFDRTEETRTADSKNIILTTFTVWTIADPYEFHRRYKNEADGERALRTKIRSHKLAVAGKHDFREFVSTDPAERHIQQIEQEMMDLVKVEAAEEFGVEIRLFGLKQLGLPEEVTKVVFDSMKKGEETKARNLRAEGLARANEIVAQSGAAEQRILAAAKRKVVEYRNQAQAEVSRIYAAFQEHEELRIYLDKLQALEEVLRKRTTLIFGPEKQPFDLFDEGRRVPSVLGAQTEPLPAAQQTAD